MKLVARRRSGRRWTLAEIAREVGQSPVYLTQAFQQVEGVPLYRHQLRLRLAHALDLIAASADLTALSLDLGAPCASASWGGPGRAVAHEIGHYVLASPSHAEAGLMRAGHRSST